ncbi:unnamed protein product, partial [Discosporangium mesarthrocarpum]
RGQGQAQGQGQDLGEGQVSIGQSGQWVSRKAVQCSRGEGAPRGVGTGFLDPMAVAGEDLQMPERTARQPATSSTTVANANMENMA